MGSEPCLYPGGRRIARRGAMLCRIESGEAQVTLAAVRESPVDAQGDRIAIDDDDRIRDRHGAGSIDHVRRFDDDGLRMERRGEKEKDGESAHDSRL